MVDISNLELDDTDQFFHGGLQIDTSTLLAQEDKLRTREETLQRNISFAVPAVIAGGADTIAMSLGLADEEDVTNFLTNVAPGLGDYYRNNRELSRTIADIPTMFIPGMIGVKAIRAGSLMHRLATGGNKSALLNNVFSSATTRDVLFRRMRLQDSFLANQGVKDLASNQLRKRLSRQLLTLRVSDNIKETLAFEGLVLATMNQSDILYPDQFSFLDHVALNGFFPAAVAGADFLRLRRMIRGSAQTVGLQRLAEQANDPQNLQASRAISRSGARDYPMTINAVHLQHIEAEIGETAGDQTTRLTVLNGLKLETESQIKKLAEGMAKDKTIGTNTKDTARLVQSSPLLNSHSLTPKELGTVTTALRQNNFALAGTISLEPIKTTFKQNLEFYPAQAKQVTALNKKINSNLEEAAKLKSEGLEGSKAYEDLLENVDNLNSQKQLTENLELYIIESTGEVNLAKLRKTVFEDMPGARLENKKASRLEPARTEIFIPQDELYGVAEVKAAFTAEGHLILPKQKGDRIINNVNVTKVVSAIESQSSEHTRLLLKDIGGDWHVEQSRGKEIFNTLSVEAKRVVNRWARTSSGNTSTGGGLRDRFADVSDEIANEIYNAYAPLRARLAELASEDGTIPLLRGETKAETINPTNDLVSMTADPNVARSFAGEGKSAGNIISRRVPVEDFIMIGGFKGEFEFVVKGNLARNTGEQVSQIGIESMPLAARTGFYAAMRNQIELFDPNKTKIFLTQSDHHTRIDYVLELLERQGDNLRDSIVFPRGIDNLEQLEFLSASSKYREWLNAQKLKEATTGSDALIKIPEEQLINEVDMAKSLNLPSASNGTQHPLLTIFNAARAQGDEVLEDFVKSPSHLRTLMEREAFGFDVAAPGEGTFALRGRMLDVDAFNNNKAINAIKRPLQDDDFITEAVIANALREKEFIATYFGQADEFGADLVKLLYDDMTAGRLADAMPVARQVDTIMEGAQAGRGAISTQVRAAGETPAMIALHDVETLTTRQAEEFIGREYKKYEKTFQKIRSSQFAGDRNSFVQFVDARRVGWDLEDVPVALGAEGNANSLFGFVLKQDSTYNKKKFKEIFGRDMEEGELMPSMANVKNPTPVAITQLGVETATAYSELGITALRNSNHIRRTMGLGAINEKAWWVPPRNLARQETHFILDNGGNLISLVPGRTANEAADRAQKEVAALIEKNPDGGFYIANQQDISTYFSLQDEAFERLADFSDSFAQTARAKGNVASQTIDIGMQVLDDMNGSINKQFQSIPRRVRALMFEGEINYLRNRYNAADIKAVRTGTSIWQQAIASIHGNQTINPNQMIGKVYNTVESTYDEGLNRIFDKVMDIARPPARTEPTRREVKTFESLDKTLGEYNPFANATDFAAKTHQVHLPPRMKQHAAKLNNFAAFMALRLLDAGHAMLNIAGSMATYAPIVRALKPRPGEALEIWQSRIGAYGTAFPEQKLAMFSPTRALADVGHWWFTDEGRKVIKLAADKGVFKQDVAELVLTAGANHDSLVSGLIKRNSKYLTILADKSEELSRLIGWSMGYRIGTRGLGMGEDQAFTMAQRFANNMVGDYRPNNRPRVFQGAAGMPLGLFTTYMWNFYQRLFGYIENGQTRALVTQFATQASIFGGLSVPGMNQFVDFFASNYDGTVSLPDGIQSRLGSNTADWFLYGAVSNAPKMFGAEDGIAFFSRGDLNMHRVPFLPSKATDIPSIKAVSDTLSLIGKTAEMMVMQQGFSTQQMYEIVGNYSVSRPARMLAYMGAGAVTDRRGQVVNSDVFTGMSIAARGLGLRPLNETKRMEAHAAARFSDMQQRSRMLRLRDKVRADIRGNKGTLTADQFNETASEYFKYGNPQYFTRFITEQILAATQDRDSREIIKALRDPTRGADVQRYLNANTPTDFVTQ